MRSTLVFLIFGFLILCAPAAGLSLEIASLSPARGGPGTRVTVTGGPFAKNTKVVFGDQVLAAESLEENRLIFSVPVLSEGDYILYLRNQSEQSPRQFVFEVIVPTPWISSISPPTLDECSSIAERQITISGRDFLPEAQVLLNEAAVPVEELTSNQISLVLPKLQGGRHEIQVVNPGGEKSISHALNVEDTPEILSVDTGEDNVNSYQLIIQGNNFEFGSQLYVDGEVIVGASIMRPKADSVIYIDCHELIYIRHPVSRVFKRVALQVVNPDGEQSPVFHVTIP